MNSIADPYSPWIHASPKKELGNQVSNKCECRREQEACDGNSRGDIMNRMQTHWVEKAGIAGQTANAS
jgi:hypothetical protein